jgi:hypothetical protein
LNAVEPPDLFLKATAQSAPLIRNRNLSQQGTTPDFLTAFSKPLAPSAKVWAFELNSENFKLLRSPADYTSRMMAPAQEP